MLAYFNAPVVRWYEIGMELGIHVSVMERIKQDHQIDATKCLKLMVCEWLKSPQLRPCWHCLVKALEKLGLDVIAGFILNDYG